MSEKLYSLLLQLYPVHFREAYGEEARQLFRDRAKHESTLRLWLDLLTDLALSLPIQHLKPIPQRATVPSLFHFIGAERPRPTALLFGGLVTLSTLALMTYAANHRATRPPAILSQIAAATTDFEKQRILHAAIAKLKEHYVDHDAAPKVAVALLAHEENGDYKSVAYGPDFAALVARHMREASHDSHLDFIYSQSPLPNGPPPTAPSPESRARYRKALEEQSCSFEKIETLPHNIGYLKFNSFPDTEFCQSTATAAMATLNHSDALIVDLRNNRGGYGNMVMLLSSYLFDHPQYMYNPRENTNPQSWTQSPIPDNQLADKPLYLLTSNITISAAEQFTYNLKMLKRVTLVGETTHGSAHSGVFYPLNEHFAMAIPDVHPTNPYGANDWEGVGITPDIKVPSADALKTAIELAERRIAK
jgi:Peptidase family S41